MVRISHVLVADDDALTALNRLLPQLSSTAKALEIGDLEKIVAADTTLFLAYVDEIAVGTLSLIFYRTPSVCGRGSKTSSSTDPHAVTVWGGR